MHQLLDSPSKCLASSPLHNETPTSGVSSPSGVPAGDIRQVINHQSDTSRAVLPPNDLRHKIGRERRGVYFKDYVPRCNGNVNTVGANSRIPGVAIASSRLDIACNVGNGSRAKAVVSTVNVAISCKDDNNGAVSDNVETVIIRDEEDLARKRYADNAANALRVLKHVFRGEELSDSQPPVSPQELRGPTTSAPCIDDSEDPLIEDSCEPSCISPAVAPPLPVNERLHPVRHLHDPSSHRRVCSVDIQENIRRVRFQHTRNIPSPPSTNDSSPPTSSPIPPDDCESNASDIPSAQPRAERPANNVNDNVNPETQPPPPNDDDNDPNGPHDTSEALLLPDEDLEKLKALREKWTEILNLDLPWD